MLLYCILLKGLFLLLISGQITLGFCFLDIFERSTPGEIVNFLLFSQTFNGTDLSIETPKYELRRMFPEKLNTKILIHGWKGYETMTIIKDAYMESRKDVNVILCDWNSKAETNNYLAAASDTRVVGEEIAKLILYLSEFLGEIHCIGHSLGAHVAGYCGAYVKEKKTNGREILDRITGLDPAGPGFFTTVLQNTALDKTHAKYVDVISTCDGLVGNMPDIDFAFYPNGGVHPQPGSDSFTIDGIQRSHTIVCNYFQYSIILGNDKKYFEAKRCKSKDNCEYNVTNVMGEYLDVSKPPGDYYLTTTSDPPYAEEAHE